MKRVDSFEMRSIGAGTSSIFSFGEDGFYGIKANGDFELGFFKDNNGKLKLKLAIGGSKGLFFDFTDGDLYYGSEGIHEKTLFITPIGFIHRAINLIFPGTN